MTKRIIVFLAVVQVVLSLVACSPATPQPTNPQQTIEASAGQQFQLILDSNPTTGYHWEIVGNLDPNVVQQVSKEYKSTGNQNLVGSGGVDIWTFKAVATGQTTITVGYYPPSNTPTQPDKTEKFTIDVK